jgi:hypothetical protein
MSKHNPLDSSQTINNIDPLEQMLISKQKKKPPEDGISLLL